MEPLYWARRAIAAAAAVLMLACGPLFAADPKDAPGATEAVPPAGPRLELTITGPQQASVGSEVTFELVVANVGTKAARGLVIADDFDPGLEHAAAGSPIEHDLKDLQPGQSQRLGVTFRVAKPGKLSHRVEVTGEGKVLAAARSFLTAVGAPASPTSPPQAPTPLRPVPVKPKENAAKKSSPPKQAAKPGDDDFPDFESMPHPPPKPEEKIPDLGPPLVDDPQNLKRLHEKFPVWIDHKQKCVVLIGVVCQRQVPLELFACLRGSKEHESVLSVPTKASFVHAALLAVGAEAGAPVQFRPKYVPARGSEIEITCVWKDAQGNRHSARAQDWVRAARSGKPLSYPWVFGGSRFVKNPFTDRTDYQADADGDFICVSNFPGAMLDLPIESTSTDADLLFQAFTEHIPPRGTPVTLILKPKPGPPAAQKTAPPQTGKAREKTPDPAAPADNPTAPKPERKAKPEK
jgi:hypothetical protein